MAYVARPMALRSWLMATRPTTLVAGVVPVAVGCALAGTVTPLKPCRLAELRGEAAASLEEQRAIEARDTLPFGEFVERYTAGSLV